MAKIEIIRPKNHSEWLEVRKSGIGSSEVGTILGLNPFQSRYQLWRQKMGLDAPTEENFAMRAGHYLEDAVSMFWQDATGKKVIKSSAGDWIIRDKERPFMQVSPDRTYWLSDNKKDGKGILECKTTQKTIDADDIPEHWFCQVQYQLGVAGYEHGSIAWLTAGRDFGYKDIDFDAKFFEFLCEEVAAFHNENIIGGKEPALVSAVDVLAKYQKSVDGKSKEASDTISVACEQIKEIKAQIAVLDCKKSELEDMVKRAFEDAETLTFNGQKLATWKTSKGVMKFDAKAFEAAEPELAKKYYKETLGSRRFVIK